MTAPDLDALAALYEKATPGPWTDDAYGEARNIRSQDRGIVAQMGHLSGWHGARGRKRPEEVSANVALIVTAVNALPALLAYVRELERERDDAMYDVGQAADKAALAMRERCAEVCAELATAYFDEYKGRFPFPARGENRANPHREGMSDGASACAAAIRAMEELP